MAMLGIHGARPAINVGGGEMRMLAMSLVGRYSHELYLGYYKDQARSRFSCFLITVLM